MFMDIFIGNLPPQLDDKGLKKLVEIYAIAQDVKIIKENGISRGFGFIKVAEEDANRVVQGLNRKLFEGKNFALEERTKKGPRLNGRLSQRNGEKKLQKRCDYENNQNEWRYKTMLKLHKNPKNKSYEERGGIAFIEEILSNFRKDREISTDLEVFKEHFRGQEDLILELVYFVFFTGSMNMLEDCIEDVDDDDFHDFSNRLSFLEEDTFAK